MSGFTEKKRIEYIDIARAIAIFLVVLGHTARVGCRIRRVLYSFHMPLFFMISGMLLRRREEAHAADLGKTVRKRIFSYLIPYFIWGIFYVPLNLKNLLALCYGTWEQLSKIGSVTSLWFLPVLLTASILTESAFFVFRKADHFEMIIFLVMLGMFVTGFHLPHMQPDGCPFAVDIGFAAAGFMLSGYFIFQLIEAVRKRRIYVAAGLCITLILLRTVSYGIVPLHKVSMYKGEYGDITGFLINAFIESLVVIIVSVLLDLLHSPINRGLACIGRNTLGILVLHRPMTRYFGEMAAEQGYSLKKLQVTVPIAILVTALSFLITSLINKLLPELLGKTR